MLVTDFKEHQRMLFVCILSLSLQKIICTPVLV